eukprot:11186338-Lingulodinium_polyedra.AAC.1
MGPRGSAVQADASATAMFIRALFPHPQAIPMATRSSDLVSPAFSRGTCASRSGRRSVTTLATVA